MPIRAENRQALWAAREEEILFPEQLRAVHALREVAFDTLQSPLFWEGYVATVLGGSTTPHRAEHDVEVQFGDELRCVEVKFSTGYLCNFSKIRGKGWRREVFRWSKPRGCRGKDEVDAIVLIGRSLSGNLYSWAIPREHVAARCPSISVTCPDERKGDIGKWDRFAVPFDQIAPAVRRIMRGEVPPTIKATERQRIRDKAGQLAFEVQCFGPAVIAE